MGQWAKKIRGRPHDSGPGNDPESALAKYLDERADLQAQGRRIRIWTSLMSRIEGPAPKTCEIGPRLVLVTDRVGVTDRAGLA
jgi:hypothetical protein